MSAEDAAPAAGNALTKKIGPLPVGVWLAAIGLGAGIAWYSSRGARANAATAVDGTDFTDRLDNTMPGAGNLAGALSGVVDVASSLVTSYSTNEEWQSASLRKLISKGWDPTVADAALRAYVGSQTLTISQKQAIDDALLYVGPPPVSPSLPASGYVVEPAAGKTATPTQNQQGKDTDQQAPAIQSVWDNVIVPASLPGWAPASVTAYQSAATSSLGNSVVQVNVLAGERTARIVTDTGPVYLSSSQLTALKTGDASAFSGLTSAEAAAVAKYRDQLV